MNQSLSNSIEASVPDSPDGTNRSIRFTVFTPTYNRSSMLHRVYESLCAQTVRNFEWLIVDDGSTDDTAEKVKEWIEEGGFPIRYIKQPNQGKHIAFNTGVENASGELFLTADSDDRFKPQALERFEFHWCSIPEGQREHFVGATCLCENEQGALVGDLFPSDVIDSDSAEIRYRYKANGEKWGFQRTEVLKNHPFPPVDKKKGYTVVPEDIVWLSIATRFKTRFFNERLRIFHIYDEGESLTRTPLPIELIASGLLDLQRVVLNTQWKYVRVSPFEFVMVGLRYARFAMHAKVGTRQALASLTQKNARRLVLTLWPFALLIRQRDQWLGKI
jgi:glycosyltransferase involved in cell wall biosynthesis